MRRSCSRSVAGSSSRCCCSREGQLRIPDSLSDVSEGWVAGRLVSLLDGWEPDFRDSEVSGLRVAVMGKGPQAIRACQIVRSLGGLVDDVIVMSQEPAWCSSFAEWASRSGFNVTRLRRGDEFPQREWDLGLSVFFDGILSPETVGRFQTVLNLHNAPLPRYRGMNPVNWALVHREQVHGVTLHDIDSGIDTGPIVDQIHFEIDPDVDEVIDVYLRCLDFGRDVLIRTLPSFRSLPRVEQDHAKATYFSAGEVAGLGDRRSWTRAESC